MNIDGTIYNDEHSYNGEEEPREHLRVYGNEGQMIDMDHDMGAPGANANLAEDVAIEEAEIDALEE